jgi:anti-sigma B factor antagonist
MDDLDNVRGQATVESRLESPGSTVVRVAGELDLANVPGVESELEPILGKAPDLIVFDLSNVTFMDSSGIAMLLRVAERVPRVEVRDPSAPVELIIRATGLSEVLNVVV